MADKVMRPTQTSRPGGIKQVKNGKIEGPTASASNLNPFNRNKKK